MPPRDRVCVVDPAFGRGLQCTLGNKEKVLVVYGKKKKSCDCKAYILKRRVNKEAC